MSDAAIIPTGSELDRMIERERFILETLNVAYNHKVLDYARFSIAYDATVCRLAAMEFTRDSLNAATQGTHPKPHKSNGE